MARQRSMSLAALLLVGVVFNPYAPSFTGISTQLKSSRAPATQGLRAAGFGDATGSASKPSDEETSPLRLGGAFVSMLAALVLAFMPVAEAQAARSGGRMGGSSTARRAAPPPTRNNTTIINKTTVVAPPPAPVVMAPAPVMGGFGMMGAPVVVAPPPTLGDVIVGAAVSGAINGAINSNRGPSGTDRMLENQIRQDERQMDRQAADIDALQRQIAELKK